MQRPRAASENDSRQRPRVAGAAWRSPPTSRRIGKVGRKAASLNDRCAGAGGKRNHQAEQDGGDGHIANDHRDDEAGRCHRHGTEHRAEGKALLQDEIRTAQIGDPEPSHDAAGQHDRGCADEQEKQHQQDKGGGHGYEWPHLPLDRH